jgi:glycosyltransferase involved in cell wall biosynthesis
MTPGRMAERAVVVASAAAAALAVHSLVNLRLLRSPPVAPTDAARRPTLSVLIPARDEAARLGPTLDAVVRQAGVDLEVLVLDDGSTDGTAALVRARATATAPAADPEVGGISTADGADPTHPRRPRVRLLTGRPLPEGWLGKPHACAQLAEAATGEVLVFLDADVRLRPGALAACADLLQQGGFDMVSPYPRQVASSAAERLVQPLLQWSWLTFLPLRLAERAAAPALTAGNGQLLVCRAAAYRAAGGHARVRDAVIEDVALARAFKSSGLVVAMADGTSLATCRMYTGWAELREGYAKSLWSAFGSRRGALATMALLAWLYVVPPLGLVAGLVLRRSRLAAAGGAGYAAAVAGRALVARRTGGRIADAVAHPASVVLLGVLTRESWRRRAQGTLTWKGRPVS